MAQEWRPRPRSRALCLAAIGWGIAILAAAVVPDLPLELAAMIFVGYGSITFNSLAKTTLQLAAKPTMRGQVMALWALAWLGSTPIGGPIMGWVAQETGARWSLVVGGAAALLSGALALPAMLRMESRLAASPAAEPLAAEPPAAEPLAAVSEPPEAEPPAAEPEPATATANLP